MSVGLRIILILISALNVIYILRKIRQSKLQIEHSLFWIGFSALLLFMSLFPDIIYLLTDFIGVQSPVNLVFLVIIFILILKNFTMTLHVSNLEYRLSELVQKMALDSKKEGKNKE